MTSSNLESKAKETLIDDHFDLTVSLYSQAINICPSSADLFVNRAQAFIKPNSITDVVADTNKAIKLDPKMAKAYLRKDWLATASRHGAQPLLHFLKLCYAGEASQFKACWKRCYRYDLGTTNSCVFVEAYLGKFLLCCFAVAFVSFIITIKSNIMVCAFFYCSPVTTSPPSAVGYCTGSSSEMLAASCYCFVLSFSFFACSFLLVHSCYDFLLLLYSCRLSVSKLT